MTTLFEERLPKMDELMKIIGYKFKDKKLLRKALLAKDCAVIDLGWKGINQNSLEKVGNALIGFLAMEKGYLNDLVENKDMKAFKKKYTDNDELVVIVKNMKLDDYVFWSKNQFTEDQWLDSKELFVDSFEAIIGAIYFDRGLKKARKIFWNLIEKFSEE